MYHPRAGDSGRELQFIEFYNSDLIAKDLSGFEVTGAVEFVFPPGTTLPADGYLVVAQAPRDVEAFHGISGVLGGFDGSLPNSGGTVRLRNPAGAILLEVTYSDRGLWPVAADGAGPSLVLARPSLGEGNPAAWAASEWVGGSPGGPEPVLNDPLRRLRINELLARPEPGGLDYLELYNHSAAPLDISGCILTDSRTQDKFQFPPGTLIPGGGFLRVDETQFGFGLSGSGEAVYLRNPDGSKVLDAVRFGAQARGISLGRFPDGSPEFRPLERQTPGAPNAPARAPEVVINEIMYHPLSGDERDSYVEVHNPGDAPIGLSGWGFVEGIDFRFPEGAVIESGGYVVVAKDARRLIARYPGLTPLNTYGDFEGRLSRRGERLVLARPDPEGAPGEEGDPREWLIVDEVFYQDGGRWPALADGGGSSLELKHPRADNRFPDHWGASDESARGLWTTVEHTGVLDHGVGSPGSLHILLLGAGECLVDQVEVYSGNGPNLVANPDFESGVTGWVFTGTHSQSAWEPEEGFDRAGALRVRAVGRGDTGANRIRATLTSAPSAGQTVTIRARVRWISGHPEILLRLYGNHLEAAGRLEVAPVLGTPGEPNSRAAAQPGPAIREVTHWPVLPRADEPVRITAYIHDPDGLARVQVRYRLDPDPSFFTVPMWDDGTGGDAMAGDGIFTAVIPGQSAGRLAAFHVEAAGQAGAGPGALFPAEAPENEALIRWGEVQSPGRIGTYRLWMTAATRSRWSAGNPLDNSPFDVTFVYNDERVIYNAGAYFKGSPHIAPSYNTPDGRLCGYNVILPKDDRFLGVTDVVLDWPSRDNTAQQEPYAYYLNGALGLPANRRRYVHLHVNGVTSTQRGSIYEDAQQVNSDLVSSWMPHDPDGELFKIEQWFEFTDSGQRTHTGPPRLEVYATTGGEKKIARYRWNWLKRAVKDSAHEFSSLMELADAANAPPGPGYVQGLQHLADVEQWMRVFAVQHIVVNFDSYGSDIGKNMYAYKPRGGRWQMYAWDIDWVMTASAQHGYSPASPLMYRGPTRFGEANRDPVIGRMYDEPVFQRAFWRAVRDAVHGPMHPLTVNPRMAALHAALVAEGVTASAGQSLASPSAVTGWIAQRRAYLTQQLESVAAPFALTSPAQAAGAATQNPVRIQGTAPIAVQQLALNGLPLPVRWTGVTAWETEVPLQPGHNVFLLQGLDPSGQPVPDATIEFTLTHTGPGLAPEIHPVINEWMASNQSIPNPVGGRFDDWFELFNPHSVSLDLGNYFLSDTFADRFKFRVPPGVFIPPHGFLWVWADTQSGATPGAGRLHANFKLTRGGDQILLTAPDGRLVDWVSFEEQPRDGSVGRWPDGAPAPFFTLSTPTPGEPNFLPSDTVSPLRLHLLGWEPDGVRFEWNAVPGVRYRVLFKDDLSELEWRRLEGEVVADGPSAFAHDPRAGGLTQRYYRIQVVQD